MRLRERSLVCVALCYMAGLVLAGVWAVRLVWAPGVLGAGALLCAGFYRPQGRFSFWLKSGIICLTAVSIGLCAGFSSARPMYANVDRRADLTMTVRRVVKDHCVLTTGVTAGGEALPDALVYLSDELDPLPGQKIFIRDGRIQTPKPNYLPYGFQMQRYVRAQGASLVVYASYDEVTVSGEASGLLGWCERVRRGLCSRIDALFAEHAPLIKALLAGVRGDLSDELNEDFTRSGITHLLAISGLHLSLICSFLFLALSPLRLGYALRRILVMGFGVVYACIVGLPPSVVRAVIMLCVFYLAQIWVARYDGMTALALTALLLLTVNPAQIWSAGFQLSFAAVAGILYLTAPLQRFLQRAAGLDESKTTVSLTEKIRRPLTACGRWLCGMFAVSIGAQVFVLPLSAWLFGQVSLVGLLVNLPAIPLATLLILASGLALMLSLLPWQALALAAAKGCGFLVALLQGVAGAGARFSFSTAQVHVPWGITVLIYLAAFFIAFRALRPRLLVVCRLGFLTAAVALYLLQPVLSRPAQFTWTVFPVGDGDASLLQKGADTVMIDCSAQDQEIYRTLCALGVDVDVLVLSHGHEDHAGGLLDLIKYGKVKKVVLWADADLTSYPDSTQEALRLAPALGIPVEGVRQGDVIRQGEIALTVLSPTDFSKDENRNSLVLLAQCGESRILLMGDADTAVEAAMDVPEADAIKVAHHGSKTATSEAFLRQTNAGTAVISVAQNHYGHPNLEVLCRLWKACGEVYITQFDGVVKIRFPN